MKANATWLWAVVLSAACGGSAYKANRTGGSAAGGGAGGGGGAVAGAGGTIVGAGGTTSASGGSGGAAGAGTGGDLATGGSVRAGGATSSGGFVGSGGAAGKGGATASGGATSSGGSVASGGATGKGGATASGGATGGTSTTGRATGGVSTGGITGAGGVAGSGGTAAVLQPCNSSDGSGCGDPMSCVDTRSDSCTPDTMKGCTGYCAPRRRVPVCAGLGVTTPCPQGFACTPDTRSYLGPDPVSICVESEIECATSVDCPTGFVCVPGTGGSRCSPERVVCDGAVTCKMAEPPRCPAGYGRSTPDGCYGPCVPVDYCACATDAECSRAQASCDRKQGRCFVPQSPEPGCQLPFEVGPCDGAMRVYAFVDGDCKLASYGGCGGNDNRFATIEECLARCRGMPGEQACPDGRVARVICLGCGLGGGCMQQADACAKTCTTQTDCQPSGLSCANGYCEAAFCI